MATPLGLDGNALLELTQTAMPYGRYKGCPLLDVPEAYLVWMQGRGWPRGKLGAQLALALEIKHNGLTELAKQAAASARRS